MVYKANDSIISIQAEAINPIQTNVVFWSHDRGTAKLRMKLVRKNGVPQSLPEGTTVPIRLMFKSATAEGGYGKHDYLATIDDRVNGIVSIVLEDNILGYVGKVEGSVYIDFPDDRSLDTAGRFTFYIKRSPIDDSTPELEDYYFNGFSQTIDKIEKILADGKQEIEQKITESETQIDAKLKDTNDKITKANQDVATINTNIDKANDRIDQTNQQIGDLGKLKKMYSNSIEFGGYDYSGNPNLMSKLKSSDFNVGNHGSLNNVNGMLHFTSDGTGSISMFTRINTPQLASGKTYTLSAKVRFDEGTTGDINKLRLVYRTSPNGDILLEANNTEMTIDDLGKEITIKGTANVNYQTTNLDRFYLTVRFANFDKINGGFKLYDIKIEEGPTATPYQPNLLDAPYYLSEVALGENIANTDIQFPIKSSEYLLYKANMKEEYVIGQTYTITLKGTKPASQTFVAYNDGVISFGNLKPVEGLTDIWSLTFTPMKIASNTPKEFRIFQYPSSTVGACQIDWIKIEKSDTRTPNISQFKYFGEGLKDSNNPNDYSWDVTPEYTEKGLNNTVSLTEPQSVEGLKNFEDGLQIAGKEVATVPEDTGWVNLTAINGHSWNKQGQIRRIGKLVMFRGSLKGSTLSAQDFCTIPEGFRPSNPTDNYEYQFLLPPQSSNTLDNGGMAYIRPNGVCGLPSFRGTVNLFLAPIQYYID
ncbi:BppU family phage baseplate upper protein [Enterococcus hirae]|uniref:BppU family phage baseplate upper protein n=1 Tax=Enterococcus hirae TaxID=1354 RepID=UPI00222108CF|nr:BppU family phage baseplate upper protein [Enterococcus hirae]MDT2663161.1 BppU family phage baseplate upper protein [Enterococcus hirae]UYT92110.1 BppU family phage baseplate upper protein [Enterococcus hirae]